MNFEHGLSLAKFQDLLLDKFKKEKKITEEEKHRLNSNVGIFFAKSLAPSYLVIRHYCLIDLIDNDSKHQNILIRLIHILGEGLWLEGYSYWLYTKEFLEIYGKKLKIGYIIKFIEDLDGRFKSTSYKCIDGKYYPALYGDLEFISLEDHLQEIDDNKYSRIWPVSKQVKKNIVSYSIKATPLKFNIHVPKRSSKHYIEDGIVKSKFKWYQGYEKKYRTKIGKWFDILDPRRILSFFI